MRSLLVLLIILPSISSCKRDKPVILPSDNPDEILSGEGVYIVNEGNFGWGNSEITYYRYSDKSVFHNLFSTANGRPLGDVAQSMTVIDDKAYIVVNNSSKIEVVSLSGFTSQGTINGLTSPRYCIAVDSQKMYVSDLYSDEISVVDLITNSITGTIPFPGWSEQMIFTGQKVYIGNNQSNKILVVDPVNDYSIDTIPTANYCNSMVKDMHGNVWALCSGMSGVNAVLHCIDPLQDSIAESIVFPSGQSPWRLKINGAGDRLYYLNDGVYFFPVSSGALASSPFIPQGSSLFYSLGIDPANGDIFVGDAVDYLQNGIIYRYDSNGILTDQFAGGIIPGEFVFR